MTAINCGADAIYIGTEHFGARQAAGNSIEDIQKLADYAHQFYARVYITLNTILFDNELATVQKLVEQLEQIPIDGLIMTLPQPYLEVKKSDGYSGLRCVKSSLTIIYFNKKE